MYKAISIFFCAVLVLTWEPIWISGYADEKET